MKIIIRVLLSILFATSAAVSAQVSQVSGKVSDADGVGLPGVTVVEKGTNNGAITDIDGKYTISDLKADATLVFSFIGMRSEEAKVTGTSLDVSLKQDAIGLDEVVAVGYATVRKRDITGSVASVDMNAVKDVPATSALQSMQGRIAGVNITMPEGSPDASIKIRVRGGGSITQDNNPLFIVDGFPVSNIDNIPPADIESIDVLKDASSTAIYGSQGANGVVLVTTKSGTVGRSEINFNTYIGFKHVYNLTEVLDPYEYVYYQREVDPSSASNSGFKTMYGAWEDVGIYKGKRGNNWQDVLYGNTGVQRNYNLSLVGGIKDFRYNISYTRDAEDFIMLNSSYKRDNVNIKLSKDISRQLTVDMIARTTNRGITGPSVSNGRKLDDAVKYAPVYSLSYQDESDLAGSEDVSSAEALSSLNDPYYNTVNEYKNQDNFTQLFQFGLRWNIAKGLTFQTRGSYTYSKNFTDNIWLNKTGQSSANGGMPVAVRNDKKGTRYGVQNTLQYQFNPFSEAHNFSLLVGQELNSAQSHNTKIESKFFPIDFSADDVLSMWNYGTPSPTYTAIDEPSRTSSFFSRLNYSYKDRYIFTFTARADGKNVFSPGNRWGYFPGAAFAWRFSDEAFMQNTKSWLTDAKLRLSYGSVGNARVGSYWRQNYEFVDNSKYLYYIDGTPQSALQTSSTLKNENLTWETKVSTNVGLDLALLDARLSFTMDVYEDVTKDLILAVAIPSNSGYQRQYQNLGQTTNKGLELSANAYLIERKDFSFSVGANISFNKNTVDYLDGNKELITQTGLNPNLGRDDFRAIVGQSVGLMYGFVADGVHSFDEFTFNETSKRWEVKKGVADATDLFETNYYGPGHMKLKDLSGDNKVKTEDDRTVIGNAQPKHTGGFNLSARWKGFDITTLFNWSYGNDIYNANKINYTTYSGSKRYNNLSADMKLANRWTTIDPVTGYNIHHGEYADPALLRSLNEGKTLWTPLTNRTTMSSYAIEDGSFLRFSNLTLGYTLPSTLTRKFAVQKLRVYFTGYNLAIYTNYSGQDPEVDTRRSTPLTPGVDASAYPKAKTYLFGLNLTF